MDGNIGRHRSISEANPSKAKVLRRRIEHDVHTKESRLGVLHYFQTMAAYTLILPPLRQLPEAFTSFFKQAVIDRQVEVSLTEACVINWCRTIRPLYPLSTRGDGNCLLHAISLALWGMEDATLFLRRLLYTVLVEDEETSRINKRWMAEKLRENSRIPDGGLHLDSQQWHKEWEETVKAAEDLECLPSNTYQYRPLEEIHIFVMANILRRPVIVLTEPVVHSVYGATLAENNFSGIYLPLLWSPNECLSSPLVLGYDCSHFVPLVNMEQDQMEFYAAPSAEYCIPLETVDRQPLCVHFLSTEEVCNTNSLLGKYLKLTEVSFSNDYSIAHILSAKLINKKIDEDGDLIKDFYQALEREMRNQRRDQNSPTHCGISNIMMEDKGQICSTENCKYFSGPDQGGKCSLCFEKSKKQNLPLLDPQDFVLNEVPVELPKSPVRHPDLTHRTLSVQASSPPPEWPPEETQIRDISPREEDQRPEMTRMYSIMESFCPVEGCLYYVSVNTFPYCHAHTEQKSPRSSTKLRRTASINEPAMRRRNASSRNTAVEMGEHLNSHSLDDMFQEMGSGTLCRMKDCNQSAHARWKNFCRDHYQEIFSDRGPEGAESLPTIKNDLCKNPTCNRSSNSKLKGYCATCYPRMAGQTELEKETHQRFKEPYLCKMQNCTAIASEKNEGYCSACFNAAHSFTMDTFNNALDRTCSTPGCDGIPASNPYNLCYYCFQQKQQGLQPQPNRTSAVQVNSSSRYMPPSPSPKVRCLICHVLSDMVYDDLCLDCYQAKQVRRAHAQQAAQRQSEMFRPCASRGCPRFGTKENQGFCAQCYIHESRADLLSQQRRMTEVIPENEGRLCRNHHCDRYGDPVFNWYCSRCFQTEQRHVGSNSRYNHVQYAGNVSAHPSRAPRLPLQPLTVEQYYPTSTPSAYTKTLSSIESSSRQGVASCKTRNCPHFGNSRCAGYCNTCYVLHQSKARFR